MASLTTRRMSRSGDDASTWEWSETQSLLRPQMAAGLDQQRGRWPGVAVLTLVATALERAAFYSLQSSLVYFLLRPPTSWDQYEAATAGSLFFGMTYFPGLLFGLASDLLVPSFWGIFFGYAPYLAGYAFLVWAGYCSGAYADGVPCALSWCPGNASAVAGYGGLAGVEPSWATGFSGLHHGSRQLEKWKVFLAIAGVAIGASIQRTLVAPFGADQVKDYGLGATRSYYSWYYWSVNLGSLGSTTGLAFLQLRCGYGTGFLAPLGLLLLSWLVMTCGFRKYTKRVPNRTAIKYFLTIMMSGYKSWKTRRRNNLGTQIGWLDYAKTIYGGSHSTAAVDNVKATGQIALVIVLMLPYFVVYSKTMSAFANEGPLMHTGDDRNDRNVPASLLLAFNDVGLLVTLPLCNLVVYPMLSRWGMRLTMYKRITIGMFVIILCLLTAGGVEVARISAGTIDVQYIGGEKYINVSRLSVFAQIPQYALLGASEAFAYVSVMEFIYVVSPSCLQSTVMGFLWLFDGLSEFVGLALIDIPYGSQKDSSWAPTAFYFIAAGICLCTTTVFALVGRKYDLGLDTLTIAEPPRSIQRAVGTPVNPVAT